MKKQSRLFLKVVKAALKLAESNEKSRCREREAEERLMGYSAMTRSDLGLPSFQHIPPPPPSGGTVSEENKNLRAEVEELRKTINRKDELPCKQAAKIREAKASYDRARLNLDEAIKDCKAQAAEIEKLKADLLSLAYGGKQPRKEEDRLREQEPRKTAGKKSKKAAADTPPTEKTK